jgi:tRNA-binding EMAP/Myf-like protein
MKISVNILKQLGNIEQASIDIIKAIKEHIGEVESVQDLASDYENIVVAEIVEKAERPNAEKLGVYQLNIGPEGNVQVLAGDKTLKVGDKVAYLKPGAKIPYTIYSEAEPIIIVPRKIRGIMSNGMRVSEKEQILVLTILLSCASPKYYHWATFAQCYQLDDCVIDIENKAITNRGDLLVY